MKFMIIHYSHRHGHSIWPEFDKDITIEEVLNGPAFDGVEFEPERDEYIELLGPFDVPDED